MGLELDTLKRNDDENVIVNNTTGVIIGGFYDLKTFKDSLYSEWGIQYDRIQDYFTFDELDNFFSEHNVEYDEEELKALFVREYGYYRGEN